jgi:transcriptional regulator with XRE-family HTH domain
MNASTIAPLIRKARETRQLSQQVLADKAGLSRKSIGEFEQGRQQELGLGRFLSICSALGLEMQLLPKDLELAHGLENMFAESSQAASSSKFEQRKRLRDLELGAIAGLNKRNR